LQTRQEEGERRGTWCFDSVRQGVQIAAVADLGGDDVLAGEALGGASEVGHEEVVEGPFPAAHAGAHGFLLDVLGEGRTLLGELGVEGSGEIAHGVQCALVSFEEHLFGVFAGSLAGSLSEPILIGVVKIPGLPA
jgi:hypothetical protein